MKFVTISNEKIFLKTQGTSLSATAPNNGLEKALGFTDCVGKRFFQTAFYASIVILKIH